MPKLEVVSPVGIDAVQRSGRSPRIQSLAGKTVGEFWNGVFKGETTFPIIRRLLQEQHPGIKIIPYTEFPHSTGSDKPSAQREQAMRTAAIAKELGCDAVISGNGA